MNLKMIYPSWLREWKLRKIEKLIANMHDEEEYVIHIRNLKQASCCGLVLQKSA